MNIGARIREAKQENYFGKANLAIGFPLTFPFVPADFFYSMMHLEKPDFDLIHAGGGTGDIAALRNNIVDRALLNDATHLIMMDTDQIYHPKTITRLLSHKLPIVGAVVHRRYPPFDSLMLKRAEDEEGEAKYYSIDDYGDDELIEVDATGSGCLMFDMEVFRNMPRPWFRMRANPKTGFVTGEDIGFCQDLRAAGYKIFVDTSVPADHLTTMAVNKKTNKLFRSMKEKQHEHNMARALGSSPDESKLSIDVMQSGDR